MKTTALLAGLLAVGSAAAEIPAATRPLQSEWKNEKSYPQIAAGEWRGRRRADSQPDIEGHWSNTIANHNNWTDPQGGAPGDNPRTPLGPREERAPSRVTDPADGQLPYQPWARARQQEFAANFANPTEPRFIEPLARCAPAGVPKSFTWHGFEIRQYPQYVLILFGSGSRLIHLDGKPHLPENIKLWNADSRGHWEGNSLVVDVRNNNGKALLGRQGDFISENAVIEERYIFANDGSRFNYVARVTDPHVFTRPWTATIPVKRWNEQGPIHNWHYEVVPANRPGQPLTDEKYEQTCVENNAGFGGGAVGVPRNDAIIQR
jgi:hypothetical protein